MAAASRTPLVRTDFECEDATWRQLIDELVAPSADGFVACLKPIDDESYSNLSAAAVAEALRAAGVKDTFAFIADTETFASPARPVLCIQLRKYECDENGEFVATHDAGPQSFRVDPRTVHTVENSKLEPCPLC